MQYEFAPELMHAADTIRNAPTAQDAYAILARFSLRVVECVVDDVDDRLTEIQKAVEVSYADIANL